MDNNFNELKLKLKCLWLINYMVNLIYHLSAARGDYGLLEVTALTNKDRYCWIWYYNAKSKIKPIYTRQFEIILTLLCFI